MTYQQASANEKDYIVRAALTQHQKQNRYYMTIKIISNTNIRNLHSKINIAGYSSRPIINKPGVEAEKQLRPTAYTACCNKGQHSVITVYTHPVNFFKLEMKTAL